MSIKERVYNYKTKHEQGFVDSEIKELLKLYPDINMDKFDDALTGITCMVIDNEVVVYHSDILTALRCGVENREMRPSEFD